MSVISGLNIPCLNKAMLTVYRVAFARTQKMCVNVCSHVCVSFSVHTYEG